MMDIGLLWHDGGSTDLAKTLTQAAKRYHDRFGGTPNVCYVHPTLLPDGDRKVNGILLRSSGRVLRHHFWLGQEKVEQPAA